MSMRVPEKYRLKTGPMASDSGMKNLGCFHVPMVIKNGSRRVFTVISSDEAGWEHVSVSLPDRTPTWDEMCAIKGMFWEEEDCVVQYHPPKSRYVNMHPHCLHMWRPVGIGFPVPPAWMVGVRTGGAA